MVLRARAILEVACVSHQQQFETMEGSSQPKDLDTERGKQVYVALVFEASQSIGERADNRAILYSSDQAK